MDDVDELDRPRRPGNGQSKKDLSCQGMATQPHRGPRRSGYPLVWHRRLGAAEVSQAHGGNDLLRTGSFIRDERQRWRRPLHLPGR